MGYKFNPFTGTLDTVDSPNGVFEELDVNGDIVLDDGGTYTTTVQCVTPTANRTISFPDATGTVGLVAGSSGQLVYNNAGANAGVPTLTFDGTNITQSSGRYLLGVTSANANGGALQLSGGVTFPATQVAASDPNTLDDYEEGTWTPVYTPTSGSFTTMAMNVQSARYTKIGNLVTAETYILTSNVDATGASGSVNITGLPFTSYSAQSLRRSGAIGYSASFSTAPAFWAIQENTTTINLYEARADALDVADLTTGAGSLNIIWLSVSYTVA